MREVAKFKNKDLHRVYKTFFHEKNPKDLMNDLGVEYDSLGLDSIYFKIVDDEKLKSACVKYDLSYEMAMLNQDSEKYSRLMYTMKNSTTSYRVKDLIGRWISLPHKTYEEAQTDLVRLRDRVGMMEWKTRPPNNYVVVMEVVTTEQTIIE